MGQVMDGDGAAVLRPDFGARTRVERGVRPYVALAAEAVGATRVQLRLNLCTLDQVERDLAMVEAGVRASLETVRRALRSKDTSVLSTVRANMEQVNRHLGAYHKRK